MGEEFTEGIVEGSTQGGGEVGLLGISEDPQPAFDRVEEGEGDRGGEGTLEVREDIVETEDALRDMFLMVVVRLRGGWGTTGGRVELFIRSEGGLGMFQILLRDPRIFFGRISLPSDQEGTGGRSSAVAYDLFDFVFLFSVDKVRGRCWGVPAMDLVFAIRR